MYVCMYVCMYVYIYIYQCFLASIVVHLQCILSPLNLGCCSQGWKQKIVETTRWTQEPYKWPRIHRFDWGYFTPLIGVVWGPSCKWNQPGLQQDFVLLLRVTTSRELVDGRSADLLNSWIISWSIKTKRMYELFLFTQNSLGQSTG